MDNKLPEFELEKWIEGQKHAATHVAAGSIGPPMTLKELQAISTDPAATAAALNFDDIRLYPDFIPDEAVAERVAALYNHESSPITASDILITGATTSANNTIFQALLSPGDHIISTLPVYSGLSIVPEAIGAHVSYLQLRQSENWLPTLSAIKALLTPKTKMLILNNPNNPTSALLPPALQREIASLASSHGLIILSDEIFRFLFPPANLPPSFIDLTTYPKTIVTGSLSKCWGFPGVRIGWIICRDPALREKMSLWRRWMAQDASVVDKAIAREVLSERCCAKILAKNVGYSQTNIKALRAFVEKNSEVVSCAVPTGGATAFVRFLKDGKGVDDVEFCKRLLCEKGLLIAPASLTFGPDKEGEVKGCTRVHLTLHPEAFTQVLEALTGFLQSDGLKTS